MYLLAKKLPHTLVSGESEKFKEELAKTEAKDIVAFAQAVGQQAKEIDGKVCAGKTVGKHSNAKIHPQSGRWSCVDHTGTMSTDPAGADAATTEKEGRGSFSWRFGDITKLKTSGVKPDSTSESNQGWPGTGAKTNDTAHGMAEDIGKLQRHEKTQVAGLLSRTITGAEVVEIRAVSSAMAGV